MPAPQRAAAGYVPAPQLAAAIPGGYVPAPQHEGGHPGLDASAPRKGGSVSTPTAMKRGRGISPFRQKLKKAKVSAVVYRSSPSAPPAQAMVDSDLNLCCNYGVGGAQPICGKMFTEIGGTNGWVFHCRESHLRLKGHHSHGMDNSMYGLVGDSVEAVLLSKLWGDKEAAK